MQDAGGELLLMGELVEKVGTELKATTNWARNAPKAVCLVADHGRKRAPRVFFNTLENSAKLAFWGFSEIRCSYG